MQMVTSLRIDKRFILKGALFVVTLAPLFFFIVPHSFFNRPEELGCVFRWLYHYEYFGVEWLKSLINIVNPFPFLIEWVDLGECLSCGMTRAFYSIFHLKFDDALNFNPLSLYIFIPTWSLYYWILFKCKTLVNRIYTKRALNQYLS